VRFGRKEWRSKIAEFRAVRHWDIDHIRIANLLDPLKPHKPPCQLVPDLLCFAVDTPSDFEDSCAFKALECCRNRLHAKAGLYMDFFIAWVELSALGVEEMEQQGAQDHERGLAEHAVALAFSFGSPLQSFGAVHHERALVVL
jgi:hypothetical protein